MSSVDAESQPKPAFPPTRWSLVDDLGDGDRVRREEALTALCQSYWYPAYAFVRRSGKGAEDAKDLTQGFFYDFLKRDAFAKAAPDKGRMRNFLLTALKRYLAKSHERAAALKRGGGEAPVSIEASEAEGRYLAEVTDTTTPELLFERRWAEELFQRAFAALRAHFAERGKLETFEALKGFLAKDGRGHYAEAAEQLGTSEGNVGVTVFRMRKRFREFLEAEIRQTLATEDDFDDELTHLHQIFQGR